MYQLLKKIELETHQQFEILNVTKQVQEAVHESRVANGIAVVYTPHTTTSIRLNHFEPMLLQDMMTSIYRLVPLDESYKHDVFELRENVALNERSNGHAHIKAFLLGSSESMIIESGKLLLGQRQSILFLEFDGKRRRDFYVKIIGE